MGEARTHSKSSFPDTDASPAGSHGVTTGGHTTHSLSRAPDTGPRRRLTQGAHTCPPCERGAQAARARASLIRNARKR